MEIFGHNLEILVLPSPPNLSILHGKFGVFLRFMLNDGQFSKSLELQPVIPQTQPVHR
jgi:hypothetical protein